MSQYSIIQHLHCVNSSSWIHTVYFNDDLNVLELVTKSGSYYRYYQYDMKLDYSDLKVLLCNSYLNNNSVGSLINRYVLK